MKKTVTTCVLFAVLASAMYAAESQGPAGFFMVLGPRIGGSYVMDTPESFTSSVRALYPTGSYFPAFTLFGVMIEQRILLGQTRSHFAFQEEILVGGLEQGIALPEAAVLIGYRDFQGFEFGTGPIVSLAGVSVIVAIGWTFSYRGVFVPVDLSFIIPSATRPAAIGLTTGFNFQISGVEESPPP